MNMNPTGKSRMKACVVFPFLLLLLGSPILRADAGLKLELTHLQEQHAKALAAAAEPINRSYLAALQQLQFQAEQSKDSDTVARIQAEIKALQATTVTHAEVHAAIDDTDWTWERPGANVPIHFSKDGTFQHNAFSGTWQATGGRNIKLKAPFGEITLTFNETFTEYRLTAGDKATMSQGVKGKKK